jgi:hypothetical protein
MEVLQPRPSMTTSTYRIRAEYELANKSRVTSELSSSDKLGTTGLYSILYNMYEDSWYSYVPDNHKEDAAHNSTAHRRKESLLKQPNVSRSAVEFLPQHAYISEIGPSTTIRSWEDWN